MTSRAAFTHALQTIPGAPLRGFFFRAIRLKYIGVPLSALGSKINGGRYNAAGTFEVYYLAPNVDVTMHETQAVDPSGVPKRIAPLTVFTIDVELQHIVDLTSNATLSALSVTAADLTTEGGPRYSPARRQSRTRSARPRGQPMWKRCSIRQHA